MAPPVLTLLPAAFEGGSQRGDACCLRPGEAAAARVYAQGSPLTFTVRGASTGRVEVEVVLGEEALPRQQVPQTDSFELTYQAHPPRGEQALRVSLPRSASADLCISEVALKQP